MFKIPTSVTALFVAGLLSLACTSSGAKSSVGDGAVGGQAGSTSSGSGGCCAICNCSIGPTGGQCDAPPSCNPGDMPATSDSDCVNYPDSCYVVQQCGQVITCIREADAGVFPGRSNGDSGAADTGSLPPMSTFFPLCNPGDQQVASAVGLDSPYPMDLSADCPAEHECYSVYGVNGSILCMLPDGVHCDDPLSCNPGDTQVMSFGETETIVGGVYCPELSLCYRVRLCNQFVLCGSAADAGVHSVVCSGTWSDGIPAKPSDASPDGGNGEMTSCCGDGIIETGEECDVGNLNGVPLDENFSPSPNGEIMCDGNCLVPLFL